MPVRGIRGANTAGADQPEAILAATRELLKAILAQCLDQQLRLAERCVGSATSVGRLAAADEAEDDEQEKCGFSFHYSDPVDSWCEIGSVIVLSQ